MDYTDLRWRLFVELVANPEEEWTAPALAVRLYSGPTDDPGDLLERSRVIRDTFHVLMADQWVEPVPFQRALTVRLTETGRTRLRQLLARWSAQHGEESGA